MNDQTDSQLLRAYAEHRAELAFAELVRRHVDFVYSAALRMVCDSHLAEDVTQGVFVALAKQAVQLANRPVLSGWLHCTARNIAAQTVRTDVRRRAREQEAVAMNELIAREPEAGWEHIAPYLDAALGELGEVDRDALLLRYFERKSAQEMAQTLGISNEAAQKRVSRAVEKLRELFSKQKITIGASGLAVLISANAVQSAPIGLAATISTAAVLAGTAVHTSTVIAATKIIAMTTFQKTLVTATVAVLAGAGIYETRQAVQLREQNQTLQRQQAPLAEQIRQLKDERDHALSQVSSERKLNAELISNAKNLQKSDAETWQAISEKTKKQAALLATMGAIRGQSSMEIRLATNFITNIQLLKEAFERMPDKKIPELALLDDSDWVAIVTRPRGAMGFDPSVDPFTNDDGIRQFMSEARQMAKSKFAPLLGTALSSFTQANDSQLPANMSQLQPYLKPPADEAMLERYQLTQAGNINYLPNSLVIAEKSVVDDQFDTFFQIGPTNYALQGTGKNESAKGSGSWGGNPSPTPQYSNPYLISEQFQHRTAMEQLDMKLKRLERVLTPEQFQSYKQKKIEQFQKEEEAIKLLESFEPAR